MIDSSGYNYDVSGSFSKVISLFGGGGGTVIRLLRKNTEAKGGGGEGCGGERM